MIYEVIVTTVNEYGAVHIAPMGIRRERGLIVIAPFKPSATLENIQRNGLAVVNRVTDVRVFAGCLTGRKDWPLIKTTIITGQRLACALSHIELELQRFTDDDLRPECFLKIVHEENHQAFIGFNRAQAAVLEAAILVSRSHILPKEKIKCELEYLSIAIEKTAGENELAAWDWLMEKAAGLQTKSKKDFIT